MTVPEPTYITADEVQEQTLVTALAALEDANIDKLIQVAEDQIDAFCGPQRHHPDDTNTDRLFPRVQDVDEDLYAIIPYKVARAALSQVEWLYTQWWDNRATEQTPIIHQAEEVSIGGDGGYREKRVLAPNFAHATICPQAQALLTGFVSRSAGLSVSDPDLAPLPT